MAKRPNLGQISSTVFTVSQLNSAYEKIDTAFDNTLSRDGSTPNTMLADLDMNSNDILNVGTLDGDQINVNEAYIGGKLFTGTLTWRSDWTTSTSYQELDLVKKDGVVYVCLEEHSSGTFSVDLSASKWEIFVEASGSSGGGGVTDHGDFTGLADDDHTQYHNDARGDARYYTQSQVDTALSGKADTSHTHTASEITDFDTEVANNAAVAANTAKVTNAAHTGDVTGSGALTIDPTAITGKSAVTADGADYVLISDTSDSGNLKKALVSDLGGGGGSGDVVGPGSSTDNALVRFDSTTGKLIQNSGATLDDNGVLTIPLQSSIPASPSSGNVSLFARALAGRAMPAAIGPSGIDTFLQPHVGGNRVMMVSPSAGTGAPWTWGGTVGTTGGVSYQQTFGSSNRWLSTARKRYSTTSTVGQAASVRQTYTNWMRGSAAGFGGFFFRAQVGMSINLNGSQCFVGLCQATGALGGDPSTDFPADMCGIGWDSSDPDTGNWQFFRNDVSGSPVKVDLGATHAARAADVGWELNMFMAPGGSELFVQVINLNTGGVAIDTSYTTDIPSANSGMGLKCDIRNGSVASAVNIEFAKIYIEADY